MKHRLLLIAGCLLSLGIVAQKGDSKDYAKMKLEVNEKIFGTPDPYFKDNTVPEQFKNESAVILAQKHTIESDSKHKVHFSIMLAAGVKYSFFDIFRRKILVNDKAALEEFSQLNFTKMQSKNWTFLGKNKNYTFINIRLIKPNGTTKEINVDESKVTVKDEKNSEKNKIAIPDLAIGDIIDYYVCSYYQANEDAESNPLVYILGEDYPVINYVISLQFDARIAAEYQAINGAPDFKISPDEDGGGNILSMVVRNVPKIKGLTWSSAYRQLPVIRLNYKRGDIVRRNMSNIKEGHVEKATSAYADMVEGKLADISNAIIYNNLVATRLYKSERSDIRDAWKDYVAKHPQANNADSTAAFVFRYINWADYYSNSFSLETNYNASHFPLQLDHQIGRLGKFAYILAQEFKIDIRLIVLPGKESFTRENCFMVPDLSILASTDGNKPQYFSFRDNLEYPGSIPYDLQGEKAKAYLFDVKQVFGGKIISVHVDDGYLITLPTSDDKNNREMETVEVSTDQSDPQLLFVKRKVSDYGYLRRNPQSSLAIYEDMALLSGMGVDQPDDLLIQNKHRSKSSRNPEDELKSLLDKARSKSKDYFENEIEQNYDVKAKELKRQRIVNVGATSDAPFEYEEEFVMEGWVKKAGNNYILDLGKFMSSPVIIDKDQRERTKDIYMPFPRSFSYHIEFTVPVGYTAEGLDKFNGKTENETGGFTTSAKVSGDKLIVDIQKYYLHAFEPAGKWPLMLGFLDKALELGQQKILLKKG